MLKAAKKLKFWSKKKKKKNKGQNPYDFPPPPPLPCHCCTCSCSPAIQPLPSAPPLPPWLDDPIFSASSTPSQPPDDATGAVVRSYQQYMVSNPNPVDEMPIVERGSRTERSFTVFGCVVDLGVWIIRCFCPCLKLTTYHSN